MTEKINSSISPPAALAVRPVTKAETADDGLADMIKRIQETEKEDDKDPAVDITDSQEMPAPIKPMSEKEELSSRLDLLGLRDLQ